MIFRRSPDAPTAPNKSRPNKTPMSQAARQNPSLTRSTEMPSRPTLSSKPPLQPQSPHSIAQNRRAAGNTTGPYKQSHEQLRKLTVGRDISLNGEIATCDHLVIEGNVSATIKGGQILEITESGSFNGIVDIQQADIAGRFDGDLIVRDKLIIRPGAIVTGTIQYGRLQVDTGATLNGHISILEQDTSSETTDDETDTETTAQATPSNDVIPTDAQTMQHQAEHQERTRAAITGQMPSYNTMSNTTGLSYIGNEEGFLKASA